APGGETTQETGVLERASRRCQSTPTQCNIGLMEVPFWSAAPVTSLGGIRSTLRGSSFVRSRRYAADPPKGIMSGRAVLSFIVFSSAMSVQNLAACLRFGLFAVEAAVLFDGALLPPVLRRPVIERSSCGLMFEVCSARGAFCGSVFPLAMTCQLPILLKYLYISSLIKNVLFCPVL
ncbi:MAG: hypothetical protein M1376_18530, partial [Planctomycetes bacterium]|nr:hypothetical protein [Planctomycetota bacterium]